MQVAVWDTYVPRKDGVIMHFDVVVPVNVNDEEVVHNYGKDYLVSKNQEGQPLTARECRFCHIEKATQEMVSSIEEKGYYIIEMQNCK